MHKILLTQISLVQNCCLKSYDTVAKAGGAGSRGHSISDMSFLSFAVYFISFDMECNKGKDYNITTLCIGIFKFVHSLWPSICQFPSFTMFCLIIYYQDLWQILFKLVNEISCDFVSIPYWCTLRKHNWSLLVLESVRWINSIKHIITNFCLLTDIEDQGYKQLPKSRLEWGTDFLHYRTWWSSKVGRFWSLYYPIFDQCFTSSLKKRE